MGNPYTDVQYWLNYWWIQCSRAFKHYGYDFQTILIYYFATLACIVLGGVYFIWRDSRFAGPNLPRPPKSASEQTVSDEDELANEAKKRFCNQLAAGEYGDVSQFNQAKYDVQEESVFGKLESDAKDREREIRQQQLSKIFEVMKEHENKFGEVSMDDVNRQATLYVK